MTIKFYLEHSDDNEDVTTIECDDNFKLQIWNDTMDLNQLLFNYTSLPFVEAKNIKVDYLILQHEEPYVVTKIEIIE